MPEQLESSYNTSTSTNIGYSSANALQIRLDTQNILENIEMFLRGNRLIVEQDETGKITTKQVNMGRARANSLGVQSILNWLQNIINPQVVQGNFPSDSPGHSSMYEDYVFWVRVNLVRVLVINRIQWGVNALDVDFICDSIMNTVEPFMTRLIDNKERESYEQTLRHNESNTIKEAKDHLRLFGQGGG